MNTPMRIALLCLLSLCLALNAIANDQPSTPQAPAVQPLLVVPAQSAEQRNNQAPSSSPASSTNPAPTDSAPADPAPADTAAETPAQGNDTAVTTPSATPDKATEPPTATEPAPVPKKTAKASARTKIAAQGKKNGLGNTVPPLIAAHVDEAEITRQLSSPWFDIFPYHKTLRQVTATPPLLAGIRPRHLIPPPEEAEPQITIESVLLKKLGQQEAEENPADVLNMLASLLELQKNLKQQIATITKKQKASTSEAEKQALQEELAKLDKQLSETSGDFERIATGVEPEIFSEKKEITFSWKDELATLLEPSIKELKQLTARARLKSDLKETIVGYNKQVATARRAVDHLNRLINETKNPKIKTNLSELIPAWQNMEKRVSSKLDLAQRELAKLEDKDVSILTSSSNSVREFFRNRGRYLLFAFLTFAGTILAFRLLARLLFYIIPGAKREQRPMHVRILDIGLRFLTIVFAIGGLIFVFYTAEDWLLLSAAIIVIFGLIWTVRQALPKMWQQVRLVLNMGSIREGERIIYDGIPWRVEALNVFCKLHNPALGMYLRIPIENMVGMISRPYQHDEPWFPCKKGDWVAIDGKPFAKVVSLSHEQVEVVELGGRRTVYRTADFLGKSPANLSRNFNIRVVFGLSYALQASITTTVLETLRAFLQNKLEEHGYGEDCLSLSVDFLQAGASSLDVAILADFKGEQAPAYRRIERALAKWTVECCNVNNWEIPFPQLTVHVPSGAQS
jgi:hypothetical protein